MPRPLAAQHSHRPPRKARRVSEGRYRPGLTPSGAVRAMLLLRAPGRRARRREWSDCLMTEKKRMVAISKSPSARQSIAAVCRIACGVIRLAISDGSWQPPRRCTCRRAADGVAVSGGPGGSGIAGPGRSGTFVRPSPQAAPRSRRRAGRASLVPFLDRDARRRRGGRLRRAGR